MTSPTTTDNTGRATDRPKQQENYGSCPTSSSSPLLLSSSGPSTKMTMQSPTSDSDDTIKHQQQRKKVVLRSSLLVVMLLVVGSVAFLFNDSNRSPLQGAVSFDFVGRFLSTNKQHNNDNDNDNDVKQQQKRRATIRKLDAATAGNNNDDDDTKNDNDINPDDVLNVHIVPHTHDDVGWLKTVEQYYYGLNMTIQDACVQDIIDTVIDALLENPARTFVYVEIKFFSMWWNEQNDATKDAVRYLIANDQLTFANGGWCMHDEASTHYMGMIDQTTLGHDFLIKELGVLPKVGWQLDPFGHSATQASLLTAKVGFDALYFGRIDYQDLELRHASQECEGLWAASQADVNNSEAVFWGLTGGYSGNYESPHGFCFDKRCQDPHDKRLTNMTRTELVQKVHLFLSEIKVHSDRTKGNHIMVTMGSDFNYQRASVYFANIDLLMSSIATFQQWDLINVTSIFEPRFKEINVFYSSPDYYTKMKYQEGKATSASTTRHHDHHHDHHRENNSGNIRVARETLDDNNDKNSEGSVEWKVKDDDFFPYSDCPHCFWTGYFTSRTAFKRLERVGSSFLLAARQIESIPENTTTNNYSCSDNGNDDGDGDDSPQTCDSDQPLYDLEDALGVAQHHDGVSGTAKQHVTDDYSKRVQAGINVAAKYAANKLKRLLANNNDRETGGEKFLENLSYCQLINETICEVSQTASKQDATDILVVVYNPLGKNKSTIVQLPVALDKSYDVTRLGSDVTTTGSIRPVPSTFQGNSLTATASAKFVLAFETGPLHPLGATVFRIRTAAGVIGQNQVSGMSDDKVYHRSLESEHYTDEFGDLVVSNEMTSVKFDPATGAMVSISANGATLPVSQSWGYYTSFDATIDKPGDDTPRADQNSGAYVFRPSTPGQMLHSIGYLANAARVFKRPWGVEVQTKFEEPWIQQTTRVVNNLPYIEVQYTIGPIPIDDKRGKEIVTRLATPIESNATFFTDSNGREFWERKRDSRPSWPMEVFEPVSGNYYPVNAAIYIEDDTNSMSVLTDRTQGGTSLVDGSIELMAQRRTLADDGRGVDEPLNETVGGVTPYPPYGKAERQGEGVIIRGTYRIMVGKGNSGASLARSEMDEAFASPSIFVASSPAGPDSPPVRAALSSLTEALPSNIMLVTFKKLDKSKKYLIRLGHQYGVDEDTTLSKEVTLDLAVLFSSFNVLGASERTLSGNQGWNDWLEHRLDWIGLGSTPVKSDVDDKQTTVTLKPMEVRTFILEMEPL